MAWCDKTDLSYGVYLFAFPIQQQCLAYCGVVDPGLMFVLATLMIMGIAFLSWNLGGKASRCLKLKSRDSSDYDPVLATSSVQTPYHRCQN